MCVKKKLYYALVLIFIGSFFIVTVNIFHWGKNKSDVEAKAAPQVFVQESTMPLVFTGRRELNGLKGIIIIGVVIVSIEIIGGILKRPLLHCHI